MAYGKIKADTLVYDNSGSDVEVTLASLGNKAGLASPTFTGTPAAPTAATNTNTTQIATTAYVQGELTDRAPLASPTFTGTPTVPGYAPLASPALTGTATAVNLTLSGNLQVNGTTTTVASSTMTVADKNIELAKGAANDAAADGGGITLESGDGNKTITWVDATDAWTFNQTIHALGSIHVNAELDFTTSGDKYIDSYLYTGSGTKHWMTFRTVDDQSNHETALRFQKDGPVELYHDNSKKIETTTTGVTVTGTVSDSKGDVRSIPKNTQTSAYTPVASDAGKAIQISTGGVTINSSVFVAGDAVTIINHSGSDQTITQGSGMSIYNTADGSTGNRTLAGRGMATLYYASNNIAYISGAGLS